MGKSTPSVPPPPDPKELAQEQARANRVNQSTPYGNIYYGTAAKDAAGNPILDDNGYPRFAFDPAVSDAFAVQVESPFQSEVRSRGEHAALRVADLFVDPLLNGGLHQVDLSGAPAFQSSVPTAGLPAVGRDLLTGLPSAVTAVATQPVQRGLSADGLPGYVAGLDRVGAPGLAALPGIGDFSADAQRVEDATFQRARNRLDPLFADQERGLRQSLANRGQPLGVQAGGERTAANAELERFDRARNDAIQNALLDDVQSGRDEHSRLSNLGFQTFDRTLAGRQQDIGEQMQNAGLAAQARQGGFGERQAQAALYNAAGQQAFAQDAAAAQLANTVRQQLLGENLSAEQMAQAARGQLFGEGLSNAQLGNAARQQLLGEQSALRQMQLAELASILGGQAFNPIPTGSFFNPAQIDVTGPYGLQQQAQIAAMQNAQAQQQSGLGLLGSLVGNLSRYRGMF